MEKIQTIGLPKTDPDTFIEDITNSNFTLFGNHAFPNFRPISLNYGDARFGSQDFISTNLETGEKISLDEFSESINGMSDEQYKKASIGKALTHVFTTPVLLLRDFQDLSVILVQSDLYLEEILLLNRIMMSITGVMALLHGLIFTPSSTRK